MIIKCILKFQYRIIIGPLQGLDSTFPSSFCQQLYHTHTHTLPFFRTCSLCPYSERDSSFLSCQTCRSAITVQVFQFTRALEKKNSLKSLSWSIKPPLDFNFPLQDTAAMLENVAALRSFPTQCPVCVCSHPTAPLLAARDVDFLCQCGDFFLTATKQSVPEFTLKSKRAVISASN